MNLAAVLDLNFGGKGSGCNPDVGKCGRKPVSSVKQTGLTGTEVFKDPAMKSFIVTAGGKVYGTQAPQAHDTLLIFHVPRLKTTVINGKLSTSSDKFLDEGGIEASIRMPGLKDRNGYTLDDQFGHVAITKATPDVLNRLVQTIDHLGADTIELQIGKDMYTGPKEKIRGLVRGVLDHAEVA